MSKCKLCKNLIKRSKYVKHPKVKLSNTELKENRKRFNSSYYKRNKESLKKQMKEWYLNNKERKRVYGVERYEKLGKNWGRHNLTKQEYEFLRFDKQENKCLGCEMEFLEDGKRRHPTIDHDHACCPGIYSCGNCVRGILCLGCNSAIGIIKDDVRILLRLVEYLKN